MEQFFRPLGYRPKTDSILMPLSIRPVNPAKQPEGSSRCLAERKTLLSLPGFPPLPPGRDH